MHLICNTNAWIIYVLIDFPEIPSGAHGSSPRTER
jgi:hypothetical protein